MLGNDRASRVGGRLLLGLALGIPCLMTGCGGGAGSDRPAPFDPAVAKKNQDLMSGGYGDEIRADYKAKAKARAAAKKQP